MHLNHHRLFAMNTSRYYKKRSSSILWSILCFWWQQSSCAFQPSPLPFQQKGFQTASIQRMVLTSKCTHDTDGSESSSSSEINRRSMIQIINSAILFSCPFTRGQEVSNAAPGLVQFPCNHRLMNTYHFYEIWSKLT